MSKNNEGVKSYLLQHISLLKYLDRQLIIYFLANCKGSRKGWESPLSQCHLSKILIVRTPRNLLCLPKLKFFFFVVRKKSRNRVNLNANCLLFLLFNYIMGVNYPQCQTSLPWIPDLRVAITSSSASWNFAVATAHV